ncbi:MAG: DoxX family protein [Leadbetterella sp.]|nr:DoxX family protein [Leadbetterella sp.]
MKRKILNILSVLVGLMLLNAGLNKFFNYIPVPEGLPEAVVKDNAAFAEISWLMPLIGFAEVLGGLLILFPRTRALGILIVFPVMVGVLLTHIFTAPEGLPMALVIWAVLIWIIYENRERYLPIIR